MIGMSTPQRLCDWADVQDLVFTLDLQTEFGDWFDPFVRVTFPELWNAAQVSKENSKSE